MTIYESNYRFNDPIRYFTSNDPYYWEIDNIPLKQLMENDLWLKDQLEAGIKITIDEIDRSGFSELKPYSLGVDSVVRVKPGRFSARINDPMVDFRLQEIYQVAGEVFHEDQAWRMATVSTSSLAGALSSLTAVTDPNNATFMNGLYERAFALETFNTYIAPDLQSPQDRKTNNPAQANLSVPGESASFILLSRASISNGGGRLRLDSSSGQYVQYFDSRGYRTGDISNPDYIHFSKAIETNFIKFWRGVTRTAIVDIPEELTIEVPEFNVNDFDYVDEQGQRQQRLDAEVRIDLLFIYSKPIDAPYVKVRDSSRANLSTPIRNRTITKAQLGLVKGAGVILQKNSIEYGHALSGAAFDLGTKIFANVADSLNTSGGFTREEIYGSFPSPDDLMNMTPLLTEQLEAENQLLIGQSVLPVAYVIVRKPTGVSNDLVIAQEDIVDIRPFFRTTELSYNERAGIAAANPPLSIANPVVSRLELKQNNKKIKIYVDDAIANFSPSGNNNNGGGGSGGQVPRVVAVGYVLGGHKYGPEAVILAKENLMQAGELAKNDKLVGEYGYPAYLADRTNSYMSDIPNWDPATWTVRAGGVSPQFCHDYIDVCYYQPNSAPAGFDHYSVVDSGRTYTNSDETKNTKKILSCTASKTIYYNDLLVDLSSIQDIHVHLEYLNCIPMSTASHYQFAGLSYSQGPNYFTIFADWLWQDDVTRSDPGNGGSYADNNDIARYWGDMTADMFSNRFRLETTKSMGHLVHHKNFLDTTSNNPNHMPSRKTLQGLCSLPSVKFTVFAIPSSYGGVLTQRDTSANAPEIFRFA